MTAGASSMPKVSAMPNYPVYEGQAGQPSRPEQISPVPQPSDRELEATALAGSAAIRRIIAERSALKLERERLCGIIQELRLEHQKAATVGEQYRQLAAELLVQLKQMHQGIQDASIKIHQLSSVSTEDQNATLASLARRFSAAHP